MEDLLGSWEGHCWRSAVIIQDLGFYVLNKAIFDFTCNMRVLSTPLPLFHTTCLYLGTCSSSACCRDYEKLIQ